MNEKLTTHDHFEVETRPTYIYLKFKGKIELGDLSASSKAVVDHAKAAGIYKQLNDIRKLDRSSVTIKLQTEAIGQLWKLRIFKKIAYLCNDDETGRLVHTTLETIRFITKCRAFYDQKEAIAWLDEE